MVEHIYMQYECQNQHQNNADPKASPEIGLSDSPAKQQTNPYMYICKSIPRICSENNTNNTNKTAWYKFTAVDIP